ncbi:MAG: four helix bundle protein [Bacteroidales bacterium]|nr:four helix bundle protein [Bacteroidales bacterium]
MDDFRFMNMQIWIDGVEVSDMLFDAADLADQKRYFKFAEQLRSAAMSITNNIAEGSGSFSDKEFGNFLNVSRRSVYECANILYPFNRRKIIDETILKKLLARLVVLSKMITNFRRTLLRVKKV